MKITPEIVAAVEKMIAKDEAASASNELPRNPDLENLSLMYKIWGVCMVLIALFVWAVCK